MSHVNAEEAEVVIPLHHSEAAREAVVIWGWQCNCEVGDLGAYCDAIAESFNDAFGDALDSAVTIGPVRVRARPPTVSEPILASGTATFSDGTTSNVAPSNCAVLFQKRTNRGGRKGRGRMYLPWAVGEGQVSDTGALDPALVTSYNSRAVDFISIGILTAEDLPLLLHTDAADGLGNPITSATCDPLLATQRRRLGR